MNVRNWSFFYSKEGKQELKQNILDTVSLWIAIGLLWYSFVSMIEEHFPEFLQSLDWRTILLWLFVLWLGYEWPKKYLKKLVLPCRLAGIAIPVAYILVNFEKVMDGLIQLAQIYLPYLNSYYKTAFYLESTNAGVDSGIAFTSLCMLLWWIVWMLAYGCKKRTLLGIFPIFALAIELVVGLSPRGNGLLLLLFGTVILAIMGGTTIVKKVVVLACAGLSVLLTGFLFEGDIQNLATKEQKQALLEWQESFRLAKLLRLDLHFNWEQLNNNSPKYTGKVVLEIEADKVPQSAIYLKGFYGTTYENGNWEYDDSYFQAACKKAGISEQEAAQFLFDLPYTYFKDDAEIVSYGIKSAGTMGDVAYIPYFSNYTTLDEPYGFMGDFLLKKGYFDDYIKVKSIAKMPDLYTISMQSDYYWNVLYGEEKYKEMQDTMEWYDGLADAYLEVPEDMDFIREVTSAAVDETSYMPSFSGMGYSEKNKAYHVAIDVKNYLHEQMSYSLILDDLPIGADPIEYALLQGHEGYCMHFASAATLMLREAGVPARYVSGYVVNPSEFQETDGDTRQKYRITMPMPGWNYIWKGLAGSHLK